VKFFEIPLVKLINNLVIVATCAFTGALFLIYLPYYIPMIGDGETVIPAFYVLTFLVIAAAAYSSTDIKFVKVLSVASTVLFFGLIALAWVSAGMGFGDFTASASNWAVISAICTSLCFRCLITMNSSCSGGLHGRS